jgi:hypothetical protein
MRFQEGNFLMRLQKYFVFAIFSALGLACSSSDTAPAATAGSSGASGSAGAVVGGSAGTSGSAGTAGTSGSAGTGGSAGAGGTDAGSTDAAVDAPLADAAVDSAPVDAAVVAVHQPCKDIQKVANDIIALRGCPNTDISVTIAHCEDVYTNRTQCTAIADKFAACVKATTQANWRCDSDGQPDFTPGTCAVEQDAVQACAGFASPTGQGCATDSTDACQKCAATKCCTQALTCTSNVECVGIYACISGPWMTATGGCEVADGGFTVACANACYNAHPTGQAAFANYFFAGDAGTACLSTNCSTECE